MELSLSVPMVARIPLMPLARCRRVQFRGTCLRNEVEPVTQPEIFPLKKPRLSIASAHERAGQLTTVCLMADGGSSGSAPDDARNRFAPLISAHRQPLIPANDEPNSQFQRHRDPHRPASETSFGSPRGVRARFA